MLVEGPVHEPAVRERWGCAESVRQVHDCHAAQEQNARRDGEETRGSPSSGVGGVSLVMGLHLLFLIPLPLPLPPTSARRGVPQGQAESRGVVRCLRVTRGGVTRQSVGLTDQSLVECQ